MRTLVRAEAKLKHSEICLLENGSIHARLIVTRLNWDESINQTKVYFNIWFFFQRAKALLSTGHLHRALKIAWNPLRVVLESLSNSIHMNRPDDRKWEGFLSPQDLSKELPVASRPSLTSTWSHVHTEGIVQVSSWKDWNSSRTR